MSVKSFILYSVDFLQMFTGLTVAVAGLPVLSPQRKVRLQQCDSRIAPPRPVLTSTREELGEGWAGREAPLPPSKRVSSWIGCPLQERCL